MLDPPQRGSMWRFGYNVPINYNDMSNYCGGKDNQWISQNGRCGICGDPYQGPRDHEDGGKYATGIIGRIYESGELINTTIDITANHLGYFEFRLCPISHHRQHRLTQRCLNKYLLTIGSDDLNSNTRYYLPHGNNSYFYVPVQLPHEIITCKHCVLQWKYHAGNTWGKDENGNKCLGCTDQQEEFYNCADIQIIKRTFNELKMTDSSQLSTAANWIRQSSSILIAAGAGLSASAINPEYGVGLDYTSVAAFRRLYPRMTQISTMRCMYDAIGKHDWSPELMWGYLFTHVNKCRFNWGSTSVYQDLKQILSTKPVDSFVVTTNADGMFEQNKFDMNRFLSTQGDYSLLQCLKPCSRQSFYESRPYMERALPYLDPQTMQIPSKYIPLCPRCGGSMFYCVRGGDWFIESAFDEQRHRYQDFLHRTINKKDQLFTIIEIGVGFNTPSVLRWPMDQLVSQFQNVRLIRINIHAPDVPIHARKEKRALGFDGDAATIIRNLRDMIATMNI